MTIPSSVETAPKVYPLDAYHMGIRLMVLASLISGALIGFFLVPLLIEALGITAIPRFWAGVIGGILVSFGLATLVERILRFRWSSGRSLTVSGDSIVLREPQGKSVSLPKTESLKQTHWYFVIDRNRGTVKRGSYCAACHLADGANTATVYAFLDPADAEKIHTWASFDRLYPHQPAKPGEAAPEAIDEQADLREKETQRWRSGAEMLHNDFVEFLNLISVVR